MADITTDLLPTIPHQMYNHGHISLSADELVGLGLNKDLARAISSLGRSGYTAYVKIVTNNGLVILVNKTLNTEHVDIAMALLRLHHTIITQTFDRLVENLFTLQGFNTSLNYYICYRLRSFEEPIPLSIYRAIYDLVMNTVASARTNSSIIIETPTNVHVARELDSLNITNYRLLLDFFTNFRYFNKTSISESIVFSATFNQQIGQIDYIKSRDILTRRQVFFKIFPTGQFVNTSGVNTLYNTIGLETESAIYNQLRKLVEFGITPNILCNIWSGYMNRFDTHFIYDTRLSQEFRNSCLERVGLINRSNRTQHPEAIWGSTGIIMTLPGDSVLADVIHTLSSAERKQVMFQLIYTLYVFDQLEISHGDLHTGNIFVQNISPKTFNFNILGYHFRFTTTKLVKIYDFDRSTICRNSNIRLDINDSFTINSILHPNRAEGRPLDTNFGETNIYNKNLDIIILIAHGLAFNISDTEFRDFIFFNNIDNDFNTFIRSIIPGFYRWSEVGNRTIRDTYMELLQNPQNRQEASRIFNVNINIPIDVRILRIDDNILNITWSEYYATIRRIYGRIVKSVHGVPNNQLWIPQIVVQSKENMLLTPYFAEYLIPEPNDITRGTVYSIDGRII
jgi:hypothetical protein